MWATATDSAGMLVFTCYVVGKPNSRACNYIDARQGEA